MYKPSGRVEVGTFKKAQAAILRILNTETNTNVCIKQCIRRRDGAGSSQQAAVVYDSPMQAEKLTTEINLSRWSTALQGLAEDFIAAEIKARGPPPFPIPKVAFVAVGLVIADQEPWETFLVEDLIDIHSEGPFVKYINNNSARPTVFPDDPEKTAIAKYLSFCQHVQYRKTRNLAFVSDYQGEASKSTPYFDSLIFASFRWSHALNRPTDHHKIVGTHSNLHTSIRD
jgi:hypothetical protein